MNTYGRQRTARSAVFLVNLAFDAELSFCSDDNTETHDRLLHFVKEDGIIVLQIIIRKVFQERLPGERMYRILIIEDDKGIAEGIREQAAAWDIETVIINNFRNVMAEFAEAQPHLVLMDISLPYFDGYHWTAEIRKVSKVPIIFISSAADNMNILMAMNLGADDFIAKPFDGRVLMAKVQALLRSTYDFGGSLPIMEHRGALLNTGDNSLKYEGSDIPLTQNEYRILLCLMEAKGQVVSREKLMERLWDTDSFVDENTLSVNVNRLRKKLESAGLADFIRTKHGVGYIIE